MRLFLFLLLSIVFLPSSALARAVRLSGQMLNPVIESKILPSGREGLPVWFLPRAGITVQNTPSNLSLSLRDRTLVFKPEGGWSGDFVFSALPDPEIYNGSVHVALEVLKALGLPLRESLESLDLNPTDKIALLTSIRRSSRVEDGLEISRLVLEFNRPIEFRLEKIPRQVRVTLEGMSVWASIDPLYGDLTGQGMVRSGVKPLEKDSESARFTLETLDNSSSEVFVLDNPFRVVVDTHLRLEPAQFPPGVTLREVGLLKVLSFDPRRFVPQVVSARSGEVKTVADFVVLSRAVAGINGGYFDPATGLAVDLVALNGQMLSASLERRSTVGIFADGTLQFGTPRPRYLLETADGTLKVNTLSAKPRSNWLTAFVGDGQTEVGAEGFVTLYVNNNRVSRVERSSSVPARTEWTVSFQSRQFPALPLSVGSSLSVRLEWFSSEFEGVQSALSAGPLMIQEGKYVLNGALEGFDPRSSLWRRTRQVGFGTLPNGEYALLYLEWGTPEEFARALQAAGLSTALRLDSGSSAAVFLQGKYLNSGFKRRVPNALVIMPRTTP